ncbi:right-handed parallel beta-helix repeat-containing protein [Gaetbulibacter sp. M240]|uniref:hypothetical protein n=1 Tax=Gaetbulibacter sp. M240 TaxID=3126511 RepID=UPI00374E6D69
MTKTFGILLLLVFALKISAQNNFGKTIVVPMPSGNETIDRELIVSKLIELKPGDTLQFSSGTYLISNKIQIDINGITLKGNPNKTIIRGCHPDDFTEHLYGIFNCGGFELVGQGITVENFIFEYAWHGLMIGCCLPDDLEQLESGANIQIEQYGGHLIKNNLFRYNSTGIRVVGINPNTVVIRDNIFQDNYHGLTINGSNVLVKGNRFYSIEPEKIPIDSAIDNAIGVLPFSSMFPPENQPELNGDCQDIEIIENTIEKIANDIRINDFNLCKNVIVKDNIIKQ